MGENEIESTPVVPDTGQVIAQVSVYASGEVSEGVSA